MKKALWRFRSGFAITKFSYWIWLDLMDAEYSANCKLEFFRWLNGGFK